MTPGVVDDWKKAWRWLSVQAAAVIAIAPEIYENVHQLREFLDPSIFHHAMAALGILTIVARIKKQAQ